MVRIYANLAGLSKVLSKSKLCGAEKRSLAPFVANFNRSNELFDFVDAGEMKENADFKLRAVFRQFADNPQCKQTFFAAMHDVGYVSELLNASNRDRITLIRTYSAHPEFKKLGLRMEELHGVFRNTPLPTEGQTPYQAPTVPPSPSVHTSKASTDNPAGTICYHYQKGICKFGKSCNKIHIQPGATSSTTDESPSDINDWRKKSATTTPRPPVPTFSKHSFMGEAGSKSEEDFALALPQEYGIPLNVIPLNKSGHRLDTYVPPPSQTALSMFNKRTGYRKLCNNAHLKGACYNTDCQYDHTPIPDDVRNCLKQVARNLPCPKRGACRSADCISGSSTAISPLFSHAAPAN
jgi:hypothetical protein